MTQPLPDPLTWVSLGPDDVEPDELALTGEKWDRVVPSTADNRIDLALMARMPVDGWRELMRPNRRDERHPWRLLAAPNGDGWALARLSENTDRPELMGDPGPYRVKPGRPSRRYGLELLWSEEVWCTASELNSQTVTLRNTLGRSWTWDREDSGYVHAWLLDEAGRRLAPNKFAYAPHQHLLVDLEPGESVALTVDFGPEAAEAQPGTYTVQAVLTSLDLWSRTSALVVRSTA